MGKSTLKFVLFRDEMLLSDEVNAIYDTELLEAQNEYKNDYMVKNWKKNNDALLNLLGHSIITGIQMGAVAMLVAWGLPIVATTVAHVMAKVSMEIALPLTKMIASTPICL